jgi:hypothetical protein
MGKNSKEAEQKLKSILQGAFSGPPMPLKSIPKRDGTIRSLSNRKFFGDDDANAKSASPEKKNRDE